MSETILEAKGLAKVFQKGGQEIPVLRAVDMTIARGEDISIVGQSGSGKSTLLQLLGALDKPTAGELWLADQAGQMQNVLDWLHKKSIRFAIDEWGLFSNFTICFQITMPSTMCVCLFLSRVFLLLKPIYEGVTC